MSNYSWLFNEEGKVAKGKKCVYEYEDEYGCRAAKVVELAGYRPYYTDDTPDPSNDDVNEWCYIEVYGDVDDYQIRLENLLPINDMNDERLYLGDIVERVGTADGLYDEWSIIKNGKDLQCVDSDELDEIYHIDELSYEECKKLAGGVGRGSIYLSDYNNSFGVPNDEVCNYSDGYYEALYEKHQEDECCDTLDNFAYYLFNGDVA